MYDTPYLWLIILTVGVAILAASIVFGLMRNRQRSPIERKVTEQATRREYAREDADRG